MALCFKILFIILGFSADVCMVAAAVRSLHEARTGENTIQNKKYKKLFLKSVALGIVVKLLYWLLITGTNKIVLAMFYADGLACIAICIASIVYMFPFNRKRYRKADIGLCISWIFKSFFAVLIIFLEAYFIAAPVIK